MLRQLALTREHILSKLFWSLISVAVACMWGCFFFYLHLAECVLGWSLVLHNREQDKSFKKEGRLYNSNSQHVKDFHTLCTNLVLTSKLLHGPKKLLTSPHSLLYQLVECGFGGDLVRHAHLGPVPEGVCHS